MKSEKNNIRFWGWGTLDRGYNEKKKNTFLKFLGTQFKIKKAVFAPFTRPLDEFVLPTCRLPQSFIEVWRPRGLSTKNDDCLIHALGKSYRDLVRLRTQSEIRSPDGVLFLQNEGDLQALFDDAARQGLVLVPFGGGTGVVGGTECLTTNDRPVLVVDIKGLRRLIEIDHTSLTATFGAGVLGPDLERALNTHGYTLGHFPQSFEFSTLGGWAATRSAGQNSTRYGKIEHLVCGLTVHTPRGIINTHAAPASATGPSVKELLLGSEGIYGFITRVAVKIFPKPVAERFVPCVFKSFADGVRAIRQIMQAGLRPSIVRLSDAAETEMFFRISLDSVAKKLLGKLFFKALGVDKNTCFCLIGTEGTKAEASFSTRLVKKIVKKNRGRLLFKSLGEKWKRERFELPYLRDDLLDYGYFIDTLETASPWSRLESIHAKVREAFAVDPSTQTRHLGAEHKKGSTLSECSESKGRSPLLLACHLSHAYHDGASLYFTFLGVQDKGRELEQWGLIKKTATDTILDSGGVLSHHHGIGYDHKQWLGRDQGSLGIEVLKNIKTSLDPDNLMNPGKVI